MCNPQKQMTLGFTDTKYDHGVHICILYKDDAERKNLLKLFLDSGVRDGELVIYCHDRMDDKEAQSWLKDIGMDTKQVQVLLAKDTYMPLGNFNPLETLDMFRSIFKESTAKGCQRFKVTGEMSWALKAGVAFDRLMEYESNVNYIVQDHFLAAICQYDTNLFSGAEILNVLKVHPLMIAHGQVVQNPFYVKPEEYLSQSGN